MAHALGLSQGGQADREACARAITSFCRSRGARATLVFDGPAPEANLSAGDPLRVRVLFSEARSADELILRILEGSKAPRDFIVVTSDKSLGDKARHRGASVERAHEFSRRLSRPSPGPETDAEKPDHRATPGEIEAWLDVFDPKRQ